MNESKKTRENSRKASIMDNAPAVLVVAFLAIALGILFVIGQGANKPILP